VRARACACACATQPEATGPIPDFQIRRPLRKYEGRSENIFDSKSHVNKMEARKETKISKKHFIQLANTIIANRDAFPDSTISKLADFCKTQNPNFNRDRWLSYIAGTCGPCGGNRK